MRFLADVGISRSTLEALRALGHEVVHLTTEGLEKLQDFEILAKARHEDRILLAFDLDFGDLLAAGLWDRPSVILFRLEDQSPPAVNSRLAQLLAECGEELLQGVVVIVEENRYRLRRLPFNTLREPLV